MPKTRDDFDQNQREEQSRNERALENERKRRPDGQVEESQKPQERKDDARD